jgi:hypothetical protein
MAKKSVSSKKTGKAAQRSAAEYLRKGPKKK